MVHLIDIDVIGLQSFERVFAGFANMQRRQAARVGPLAHVAVDLGGEHDLLAPPAALREVAADDLLGDALAFFAAVDVRRVPEVDPVLPAPDPSRRRSPARWCAVRNSWSPRQSPRDFQAGAAQVGVLHGIFFVPLVLSGVGVGAGESADAVFADLGFFCAQLLDKCTEMTLRTPIERGRIFARAVRAALYVQFIFFDQRPRSGEEGFRRHRAGRSPSSPSARR